MSSFADLSAIFGVVIAYALYSWQKAANPGRRFASPLVDVPQQTVLTKGGGPRMISIVATPDQERDGIGDPVFDRFFLMEGDRRLWIAALPLAVRQELQGLHGHLTGDRRPKIADLRFEGGEFRITFQSYLTPSESAVWLHRLDLLVRAMNTPDVESRLFAMLGDPYPGVRASVLWKIKDRSRVQAMLTDRDPAVRMQAALKLRDRTAILAFSDEDLFAAVMQFREHTLQTLGELHEESLLLRLLERGMGGPSVGLWAIERLKQWGTAASVAVLQRRSQAWFGGELAVEAGRAIAEIQSRLSGSPGMVSLSETPLLEGAVSEGEQGGLTVVESKPVDQLSGPRRPGPVR